MQTRDSDPDKIENPDGHDAEAVVRRRLSDKHVAELRGSGLSWATIERFAFRTEADPKVINDLLRRKDGAKLGLCLLLPYFKLDGAMVAGYVRAKPDFPPIGKGENAKPAKYLAPAKSSIHTYFPPAPTDALLDVAQPIAITEGEKKTAAIWQLGIPVVGLTGVECWSKRRPRDTDGRAQGPRQLLDDLARVPWRGRIVYLVFDSDVAANRDVSRAETSLARALVALGAAVKLVRIPPRSDGTKLGIDDYLIQQPDPASSLHTLLGQATDFAQSIRRSEAGPYGVRDGRIAREIMTRDGPVEVPLCNFIARIAEEVVRDDGGGEPAIVYGIEGERAGHPLPRTHVPADRFVNMNWPAECWGARTIVYAGHGNRDHLRVAIQMLSDSSRKTIYTHLGWREINGEWHYLHASGAIGATGPNLEVCCDPPGPLGRFALPTDLSPEMVRAGVRASLRLMDGRVPDWISVPALASVYRSVLGPCDFSVHLAGQSGAFKTELAALMEQHFGKEMDSRHLPGSWSSTGNALEGLAFAAKDALLVVDDFAPSGTASDVQRINRDAERFFRAQGNNSGRLRMTSDARLKSERPPRGLTLSTGEDTPRGQSIRARLVTIELERGQIPADVLTEFQRDAASGLYAHALAGFVMSLAGQFSQIRDGLNRQRVMLRDQFAGTTGHARTPTAVADLALGLQHFLDFAQTIGAITKTERDALWHRAMTALRHVSGEQTDHIAAADPVDLFLRLVRAAVASGRAHLANPAGTWPAEKPESWGWQQRTVGAGSNERTDWQAQGHRIGWVEGDTIYVEPESVFAETQRLAGEQGQSVPLTPRTLHKRLYERQHLARVEKRDNKIRYCVRVTLEGQRREVLCFAVETLFPSAGAPSAPDPDSSEPRSSEAGGKRRNQCANIDEKCATGALTSERVRHTNSPNSSDAGDAKAHSAHSLNGKCAPPSDGDWSGWK